MEKRDLRTIRRTKYYLKHPLKQLPVQKDCGTSGGDPDRYRTLTLAECLINNLLNIVHRVQGKPNCTEVTLFPTPLNVMDMMMMGW